MLPLWALVPHTSGGPSEIVHYIPELSHQETVIHQLKSPNCLRLISEIFLTPQSFWPGRCTDRVHSCSQRMCFRRKTHMFEGESPQRGWELPPKGAGDLLRSGGGVDRAPNTDACCSMCPDHPQCLAFTQ